MLNCVLTFLLYGEYFKGFFVIAVAREESKLVSLSTIATDKSVLIANAAIETLPVITADVLTLLVSTLVVELHRFIFFYNLSLTSSSSNKQA